MKLRLSMIIALAFIPAYCYSADWRYYILDTVGETSHNHYMDIDSSGYPHFVYYEYGIRLLKHGYFDGVEWQYEAIPGAAGGYDPALTVDNQDRVHISYASSGRELSYCLWDGANWTLETVDGYDTGYTSSITTDTNGYPHISYDEGQYSTGMENLWYAYKDINGWHTELVDAEDEEQGNRSSIALDSEEHPHIAYEYDENPKNYLKYAVYDGSEWQTEVVDYVGTHSFDCSVAIDSLGRPHIAYTDKISFFRYAYFDGSEWFIEEIGRCGGALSIALDSDDYPCIAYCDANHDYDVMYARWNGLVWEIELACDGGVWMGTQHISLSLDSDDAPHISCNEEGIVKIYYIWYGDPLDAEEEDDAPTAPTTFSLSSAYPNPSSGRATISFALPRACDVNLEVFDIKGRKVATLAEGALPAGEHQREVSGLSSGVYLYRLTADEFADIKKMVVR